jgi:hypothetical protein
MPTLTEPAKNSEFYCPNDVKKKKKQKKKRYYHSGIINFSKLPARVYNIYIVYSVSLPVMTTLQEYYTKYYYYMYMKSVVAAWL